MSENITKEQFDKIKELGEALEKGQAPQSIGAQYHAYEESVKPEAKPVMGGGLRYNSGKVEIHQVPTSLVLETAKVLKVGETKYAKNNWRKGMQWTVVSDCISRHHAKWLDGENTDEETGLSHLAHMAANIAFLIEYEKTCPELDDRFKGKIRTYKD